MIVKTQAIALRIQAYSETSRIVSWLTDKHGRISTIVKGAHRRKSAFLGQFDLFYSCELVFYLRNFHGIHTVKECASVKPRTALRELWKSAACASYFADLVSQLAPAHGVQEGLYDWLDAALDMLCRRDPARESLFWFELKLMEIMGLSPMLTSCLKCGRRINESETVACGQATRVEGDGPRTGSAKSRHGGNLLFSLRRGGVFCPHCADGVSESSEVLPENVLAVLRKWQNSPNWRSAELFSCGSAPDQVADELLGRLMAYHIGISLDSRRTAFDLLRMKIPV